MTLCSFQFGAMNFKCSPQRTQLAVQSGKSHLNSRDPLTNCLAWQMLKAPGSWMQSHQVAFVIGDKPKAGETLHKFGTPPSRVSPRSRHQDNCVCAARELLPMMRNRPCSNLCEIARAKSESKEE